ncbi:hypothetical protein MCOR16_009744 [Pyricularia oryzae]|nr:hypothetical protein MCOR15_010033 [Pyricularia oryzae]KAI6516665.1 hypothetical protein MCOR16_009744 [Pyricularia oryzae]
MPFLRRRGVIASESDMRRHANSDEVLSVDNQQPTPETTQLGEPTLPNSPPSTPPPDPDAGTNTIPATPTTTPPSETSPDAGQPSLQPIPSINLPPRSQSPPLPDDASKQRRFSMLRFRNASDSQLATRARQQAQAEKRPPMPPISLSHQQQPPPEIIKTSPTVDMNTMPLPKKSSRMKLPWGLGDKDESKDESGEQVPRLTTKKDRRKTLNFGATSSKQSVTFDVPGRASTSHQPPAYGDDTDVNGLPLPVTRLSESSRSDGSSGDHRVYGSTTTTTHTVQTTTTFFRLPRRRQKQPEPLFPIAHLQKGGNSQSDVQRPTTGASLSTATPDSFRASTSSRPAGHSTTPTPTPSRPTSSRLTSSATSPAFHLSHKASVSPATALFRPDSRNSGRSSPSKLALNNRGRSSTFSSLGRQSMDDGLHAPPRTSTSTGRKSFGDLLGLNKLRQNNDLSGRHGSRTPATPGSTTSKNNSLQIAREQALVLPERRDDDTPAKYLARLEEVVSRSVVASALSKSADAFSQAVLRSYMRRFSFFGDPMDMAIRKLLMEAELPKETQQIDRCLQAFANRYHECNPGIYTNPDQAYFIAFSLLILHTDVFNKNNKYKMQKADYLKNTHGEGIFDDILECFYDNITYTPFIHVEDDLDINGERIVAHKAKKKSLFNANQDPVKRAAKEPIDPYTLIIDQKLDILRPNLKDVIPLDDTYSYLGTAQSFNLQELQKTFFKTGVLQIVSARSRPDAFMSEKTATNPEEAQQGIVDIKITKVGLLWRKDVKKKKTRSPWQEWGAILTGAQLYFFRNTSWVKNLMHQLDSHIKHGNDGIPVIFQPPLEHFKPDSLLSTNDAVALLDSSYKKHKNAFVYVKHGGSEEVLLADNEEELNDWLAKLNYAAAFRTSGVRMRGVVGGSYDGQTRRAIRRLESDSSTSVQTPSGEVTISRSRIDHNLAQDILERRREVMSERVSDANERLQEQESKLDSQLRNARHLQILAPIMPKTRDQILLSAARIAAKLKWTRMEMWKLKCHRDILLMDLEEERKLLGLPPALILGHIANPEKPALGRETSKASSSTVVQQSPKSTLPAPLRVAPPAPGEAPDSPEGDVFQTPPTSATYHKHSLSWDNPSVSIDHPSPRKGSTASATATPNPVAASPSPNMTSSTSPTAATGIPTALQPPQPAGKPSDEHDAAERELLEQAGLLDNESKETENKSSTTLAGDVSEGREREPWETNSPLPGSVSSDKQDRNKIRRSLQRTLRESAGHLSHVRSRKGKEPAAPSSADEESSRDETNVLTRGTGSFVVHGKKASVINFGGDLQGSAADQRLRNRKTQQTMDTVRTDVNSTPFSGTDPSPTSATAAPDFRTILQSPRDTERRESAASASTATAMSFRELHRKYSTAQATKSHGNLSLPDEDSDAALSFSDGRRTPLPPIEHDSDEEADLANEVRLRLGLTSDRGKRVVVSDGDEEYVDMGSNDDENRRSGGLLSPAESTLQQRFYTPEPPLSPTSETSDDHDIDRGRTQTPLSSPPQLQAVNG